MTRISEPYDPSRSTDQNRQQLEEKGALSSSYADKFEGETSDLTTTELLDSDDE